MPVLKKKGSRLAVCGWARPGLNEFVENLSIYLAPFYYPSAEKQQMLKNKVLSKIHITYS
jgi:hypothetical protein